MSGENEQTQTPNDGGQQTAADKFYAVPDSSAPPATPPVTDAKPEVPADKPADPAPAAKPAENTDKQKEEIVYDLKLPDGSKLDATKVEEIKSFAKENGLSNEAAQKLLETQAQTVSAFEKALMDEHDQQVSKWAEQIKADAEVGGDKFAVSQQNCKRALERFGSADLLKALDETGYGNHPEIFRVFSRVGAAMANDKSVHGASPTTAKKTAAEILYGPEK